MTIPVRIEDGSGGTSRQIKISEIGELLTRPFDYSSAITQTMDVDDTAFNFFIPRTGEKFIITDIIINADHFVSVKGANVVIYESDSATSTTILKTIIRNDTARNQTVPLTGLRLDGSTGVYINAQTDSTNVSLTIAGYYVPVIDGDLT